MTTIVKGHGARVDDEMTFVPDGCTVKMYSDNDVDLATSSALVAITSGDFSSPNGEASDGDSIANYTLHEQDDGFVAKWIAMGEESSIPIKWVASWGELPDEVRLCNRDASEDEPCAAGSHHCTGVFGEVVDREIILLSCRGRPRGGLGGCDRGVRRRRG